MKIGIPKEVKIKEGRVALIPDAAAELVKHGHTVFLEKDAGILSGYSNQNYEIIGVKILNDAATLYGEAEMIVKVKEPQPQEWPLLRKDHILFSYLHLAAEPELTKALVNIGLTGVAFETVQ
ncbi:MAG: alanine dehydrogenase, partial [Gammaproteobacteria bacterium]|nr:alanine dehydrogenase [Gammaproteobacteria bacterium]